MKKMKLWLAAMAVATMPAMASAAPVNIDTWYGFGFGGVGTDLTAGAGFVMGTNPDAVEAPAGPWEFTLTKKAVLRVLDLFIPVDQFEMFNFGASLGTTSAPSGGFGSCDSDITCALADAEYSRGEFLLKKGSHSITGTQVAGIPGAGAFIIDTADVPVPAAGGLLFGALGLIGALRLRKRKSA